MPVTKDMRRVVEEGYDNGHYATVFRASSEPNPLERHFLDRFVGELGTGARVLDCGCGAGVPIDRYLVGRGVAVTGIDIAARQVERARANVPGARFFKGDFSRHDFRGERFNGIVSIYSLFHLPRGEHREVLGRMHDLLEEDGLLLVSLGTSGVEYEEERDWCGAPMAWSAFESDKYREILASVGFTIIEEQFEGQPGDAEYHFWVLARSERIQTSASP